MPSVTRTIGPLHLEDLEPHRFEDLARQLLYDFKPWRSLEATGRSGSDDGFDARGWEIRPTNSTTDTEDAEEENDTGGLSSDDRQWLIQCKREKTISPGKLKKYLAELPKPSEDGLYGIVFVAACDFSKSARDVFYSMTRELGFLEVRLWGKAEIEDQLFQPKNDHLLFAYFGISLQVRQRSAKTAIRARLAMKKKAKKFLTDFTEVLIRDPLDDRYPHPDNSLPPEKRRDWAVFKCKGCFHDGVYFLDRRSFAYLADDNAQWDVAETMNDAHPFDNPWKSDEFRKIEERENFDRMEAIRVWEGLGINQAWLETILILPYDAIVAIDEEGDEFFHGPHIYANFTPKDGPFAAYTLTYVERANSFDNLKIGPRKSSRASVFPRSNPASTEFDFEDDD